MPEDKKDAKPETDAATWQYNKTDKDSAGGQASPASTYVQPVSWTAPEYVHNQKNVSWYFMMLLAAVGIAALVYLVTRDLISTSVIMIISIGFIIFAGRKPQVLEYSVDGTGIHVGQKNYPYENYRSFSILENEPVPTILLTPLRRFGLPLHLHFDEADEDKILGIIGSHLPGEKSAAPPIDRLMTKIRF